VSRPGPGGRAFAVSATLHAVLLVPLIFLMRTPEAIAFETIRVNLTMAPPAETSEAPVDPAPAPAQPEPEPEVVPDPESTTIEDPPPEPDPEEVERPETEKPPETPPQPRPEPAEEPPSANAGGDEMNLSTEGREFPFPDYIENVIVQVRRYFRWDGDTRPRGVVYFEILSDGSVRNIRMARASGNFRFDIAVQGAVETAGNRGEFGPLPEAYVGSSLPVQIEVEPPR
jgi:protein TonB